MNANQSTLECMLGPGLFVVQCAGLTPTQLNTTCAGPRWFVAKPLTTANRRCVVTVSWKAVVRLKMLDDCFDRWLFPILEFLDNLKGDKLGRNDDKDLYSYVVEEEKKRESIEYRRLQKAWADYCFIPGKQQA